MALRTLSLQFCLPLKENDLLCYIEKYAPHTKVVNFSPPKIRPLQLRFVRGRGVNLPIVMKISKQILYVVKMLQTLLMTSWLLCDTQSRSHILLTEVSRGCWSNQQYTLGECKVEIKVVEIFLIEAIDLDQLHEHEILWINKVMNKLDTYIIQSMP